MRSLTIWITPFTGLTSLGQACEQAHALAAEAGKGWAPSLLVPTNFGAWPQAECTQSIPNDLLVASPDSITPIRAAIEAEGVGFGAWSVPVAYRDPRAPNVDIPGLCAQMAAAAGYWIGNWEPGVFWIPGDDPGAMVDWWSAYWNSLPDQEAMNGNVGATVVPNDWGLGAFRASLPNLAAGCNGLFGEVYGGLQTGGTYASIWPQASFDRVRATGVDANLYPILARANLKSEIALANRLGHGNVHVWAI